MIHWFRNKDNYPTFYKLYLEKIADEGYSEELIAMDMETTGLNPKVAEILSFGAVTLRDQRIIAGDEVHYFFNGSVHDEENIVIHELFAHTSENVISDFMPQIMGIISNRRILGHFVSFDIALLNQKLKQMNLPKLKNPSFDTLEMAMKYDGIHDYRFANRNDYTLYALCERFGIEVKETHDALADAYLTSLLYLMLR